MKLVIKLQLRDSISHIDPALFVQRYAEGLEFDEKKPLVINDCLRLIMRMDRDWMKLGRSPAGICAAALFIAARMNGFNRTPQEIVSVVKICQGTLRKRLDEFANTPSSKLTVNEFKTSWIEESQDPPCFRKANESSKEATETTATTESPIATSTENIATTEAPIATSTRASTTITASNHNLNNTQIEPEIDINADPIQEEENEESIANQMDIALTDTHIQTVLNSLETTVGEDLSFLDDDKEVSSALLTPAEIEFKSEIWSSLNWEFQKNQNEKKVVGVKEIRGKRKRKELVLIEGETVLDSVQQMIRAKAPVLSSKINYDALSEMFEVEEE